MCDGNCEGCCNKIKHNTKLQRVHKEDLNRLDLMILEEPKTVLLKKSAFHTNEDLENVLRSQSRFVPEIANAYILSYSNPDAQVLKDGEVHYVYAVQFFYKRGG